MIVAVLVAVVWGWVLHDHGWVYDDHRFIAGNPQIAAVVDAPWRAFDPATTTLDGAEPGMWRPLRTLSYAADHLAFGNRPGAWHLTGALLQGLAAGLVAAIGLVLGLRPAAAGAAALVFGWHPVQVEAVAWLSSRGDLLAGAFLLAAVLVHLRRRSPAWTALFVAGAFLSKEAAIAAPLLLATADFAAGGTVRLRERAWRGAGVACLVIVALVGVRFAVLHGVTTAGQEGGLGLGAGGVAAALPSMLGHDVLRLLVPTEGRLDSQLQPGLPLAAVATVTVLLVLAWPRLPGTTLASTRTVRAAGLGVLAAVAPVTLLQLVFPLKILVADRFLHLAVAAPALAFGAAATVLGAAAARVALAAGPVLLLVTVPAAGPWRSDAALWERVHERDPGNARALYALAETATDDERAVRLYRRYLERAPSDAGAWYRLGCAEERLARAAEDNPTRRGRVAAAARSYGIAVELWRTNEVVEGRSRGLVDAGLGRVLMLAALGNDDGALAELRPVLDELAAASPAVQAAVGERVARLDAWAAERGHDALRAQLRAGKTPPPDGMGENGTPR